MDTFLIDQILAAGKPLSGKWKLGLLHRLLEAPARWHELTRCFPEAAPNVLTRQLTQLEQDGLVCRQIISGKPPKVVEYRLTELGLRYVPFLQAMTDWTQAFHRDTAG